MNKFPASASLLIVELEECQSEIRKLELRLHEAEQKRRKVEEKHYSSVRYKQMYESEMRLNKHAMPALVSLRSLILTLIFINCSIIKYFSRTSSHDLFGKIIHLKIIPKPFVVQPTQYLMCQE